MKPRVIPPGGCCHCGKVDGMPRWSKDMTDDLGRVWFKTVCPYCRATTRRPTTPLSPAYPARRA